jgi:hypothetical protein
MCIVVILAWDLGESFRDEAYFLLVHATLAVSLLVAYKFATYRSVSVSIRYATTPWSLYLPLLF